MVKLGARIRRLRERQGVSQGELVRRTGLQASYLSKVENGVVVPGLANLDRIARAMQLSLVEFLTPKLIRREGPVAGPVPRQRKARRMRP